MKIKLTLLAAAALSGCASQIQTTVGQNFDTANQAIAVEQENFRRNLLEAERKKLAAQDVDRPFIAGNAKPLAREVAMPEVLRKSMLITALFQRSPVDLETALRQVSEASGMLITATPDALLPPSSFASKIAGAASPVQAPPRVLLNAFNADRVPLWKLLDDIARQAQVSWRPLPSGAEFFRVETRIFQLATIPQTSSTSASLGRNGGTTAFESNSKSSFETKDQNQITGIRNMVDALLSQGGKSTISPESQTLVVTDTPAVLDRIAAFVKDQNKSMSRRVRVMLEVIEVVDRDGSDVGVDWNLLYTTASNAVSLVSPGSLVSSQGGINGVKALSEFVSGSTLAMKALSEVGVVVNRKFFPFLTTSGRPVTQALRSTFSYVDQVAAPTVASSSTTTTAPTVTQKDETVGTFVTMVPTAKADGTIFMSISFDQTSSQPLVPFTVGSGATAITVQQKSIDGSGIIQEVPVRSGKTIVVGGIETSTSLDTVRRLLPGAPLLSGGSNVTKITKSRMVLLLTAVTEEGI